MRIRRGVAVCAALVAAGLPAAGCGSGTEDERGGTVGEANESGRGRPGAEAKPPTSAPRVPGVDASADPNRLFTETQLEKALLDGDELPGGGREVWSARGTFNQVARVPDGGDLWADCPAAVTGDIAELWAFRAPSVVRHLIPDDRKAAAGGGGIRPEVLLSMTRERADRYLDLTRALYKSCPRTAVDAEAGPPHTYRYTADDVELGDDAFVETSQSKDADAEQENVADQGPSYRVYVRLGGVIVTSGDWKDRAAALAAAAKAAEKVRTQLYAKP
ncbi:hypothetical protein ACH4U7_45480 [Streptomyces sp. NPDC020845]|uniref:hypothetical protein n=1 Tax=Streptomyces sp. NPDC020845 TaxID=3365096 RepID=UPI00379EF357